MAVPGPVEYTVTGITPDQQFTAQNTVVPGKRVSYKTSFGYTGTVFIPDTAFTDATAARQIIEADVAAAAVVHGMTGTVTVPARG